LKKFLKSTSSVLATIFTLSLIVVSSTTLGLFGGQTVLAAPAATAPKADTVTSASVVDNSIDFQKAISKDGKWIIATLKDLVSYKPLVLDGVFKNGKKDAVTGADQLERKIALYTQDDKRNVTHRFTLRAPKLTVTSPYGTIQHGTFKGDLYISAPYFSLVDNKVIGNIYFTTKGAETTFTMDAKSSVTGKIASKLDVDVVSAASVVDNNADFEKAIGIDGKWIIATLKDLTFTKDLVLEGNFKNGKKDAKTGAELIQRKIGLYTQDDKHVVTARFSLTAPKLTILSPMASIQHGTFKGDLYVTTPNFQLVDAKVDGNIYFTTQEAKDTFTMDAKSSVTGKQELKK
jgi:hypothetical protein